MKRGVKKQRFGTRSRTTQKSDTGSIRIISGKWRGRKLPVLNAEGLRPTTDRTKETLFNWLMTETRDAVCLDLFAGSGGLGLEALSRGASFVTFVEQNKQAARQLKDNLALLNVAEDAGEVLVGDALTLSSSLTRGYDIIFLDPPFKQGLLTKLVPLLHTSNIIKKNTIVYIECETEQADYAVPENWRCIKHSQTKQVDYRLYRDEGEQHE